MRDQLETRRTDVFDVCDAHTHVLTIELWGTAVVDLTSHTSIADLETMDSLLDMPAVFAIAARAGMFLPPDRSATTPTVTLDGPVISGVEPRARWRMLLHGVDSTGVRALWHTLRALPVDGRSIHDAADPMARRHSAADLPQWRNRSANVPFPVEWTTPSRSNRPRSARIVFVDPPRHDIAQQVIDALDAWVTLVVCAGFPQNDALGVALPGGGAPDGAPTGGFVDGALLEDARTVVVHFAELMHCAEGMFTPVVNLAARLHASGVASIGQVQIA
jgi:hypothetical protein